VTAELRLYGGEAVRTPKGEPAARLAVGSTRLKSCEASHRVEGTVPSFAPRPASVRRKAANIFHGPYHKTARPVFCPAGLFLQNIDSLNLNVQECRPSKC